MCNIVESNTILLYKIELSIAGMTNGCRRDLSYSERLESLRAYRNAWRLTSEPTFIPLLRFGARRYERMWTWPSSSSVFHCTSGSVLKLYRPPSTSRQIPERSWSISPVDIHTTATWSAIDIAQDLIILVNFPSGSEKYALLYHDIE